MQRQAGYRIDWIMGMPTSGRTLGVLVVGIDPEELIYYVWPSGGEAVYLAEVFRLICTWRSDTLITSAIVV